MPAEGLHNAYMSCRCKFASPESLGSIEEQGTKADWVKRHSQPVGKRALLAAAVSHDSRLVVLLLSTLPMQNCCASMLL